MLGDKIKIKLEKLQEKRSLLDLSYNYIKEKYIQGEPVWDELEPILFKQSELDSRISSLILTLIQIDELEYECANNKLLS
jgi:hypothetical protein